MNNLTLIYTVYEPTKKEIKTIEKNIKNNQNIKVLVDGNKNIKFNDSVNNNIIYFEENKGKFKMVYDFIKSGGIETEYFKIVDPDDIIIFKNLPSNIESGFDIVKFPQVVKVRKEIRKWGLSETWPNHSTILSTKSILNDHIYDGRRINTSDDQLLGLLAFQNTKKTLIINNEFYLYNMWAGVTNISNFKNEFRNVIETIEYVSHIINDLKYKNILWPKNTEHQMKRYNKYINQFAEDKEVLKMKNEYLLNIENIRKKIV